MLLLTVVVNQDNIGSSWKGIIESPVILELRETNSKASWSVYTRK